jgi:hypothetical protein
MPIALTIKIFWLRYNFSLDRQKGACIFSDSYYYFILFSSSSEKKRGIK